METALVYILKWAVSLGILYLPFTLLLRKEKLATFNRRLLLGIILLSALLPAIELRIPVHKEVTIETSIATSKENPVFLPLSATADNTVTTVSPAVKSITQEESRHPQGFFTSRTIIITYIIGLLLSLTIAVADITKTLKTITKGTLWQEERDGMKIYCHLNDIRPFSWFNKVAISERDYNECGREILLHEEGHITQGHSWDILLTRAVKAVQWFNPFVYMLTNDLKEIHEFEADQYVLERHNDIKSYQLLILKKATEGVSFEIANNFSRNGVRHRIEIMMREKAPKHKRYKAAYTIPATLLCIALFTKPEYIYSFTPLSTVAPPVAKSLEVPESPAVTADVVNNTDTTTPFAATQQQAAVNKSIEPVQNVENIRDITTEAENVATAIPTQPAQPLSVRRVYEYIDITPHLATEEQASRVVKCSTKILFTCDRYGRAHDIRPMGNSVIIEGETNDILDEAEDIGIILTQVASEHIAGKEWLPNVIDGKRENTYIEAHIIFTNDKKDVATQDNEPSLFIGSRPIK